MSIQSTRTLQLRICITAALMLAAGPTVAELAAETASVSEQQIRYEFDIPSMPLVDALQAFASISQQQVSFDGTKLAGQMSARLNGHFTVEKGMARLLEGTGVAFRRGARGVWIIGSTSVGTSVELEEILVTGSRLQRAAGAGASPVTMITADEIRRTGATTVRDVLARVPAASVNPGEADGFMGTAPIQLRGLSVGTTLVLIDGQRVSASGANGRTFDIGAIPLSAVERIDVVTDGSSAIYGADAIGGIVNVILKKELDAPQIEGRYGAAEDGEASRQRLSAAWGYRGERLRTTLVLDYSENDELLYSDRARSRDLNYTRFGASDFRTPYTHQGTVYALSGNLPGLTQPFAAIPQNVGPLTPQSFAATQGQGVLDSDYYANRQLLPSIERHSVVSNATLELGQVTAYANLLASRQQGHFVLVQPFVFNALPVPATNPYNPFGVDVSVDRLLTGVAPNTLRNDDRFYRAAAGLRGMFAAGWRWEVNGRYTEDRNRADERNVFDVPSILAALQDPDPARTLNLFATGPVASDQVLSTLLPDARRRYGAKEYGFGATVNGELFGLPAGRAQIVLGMETANDSLTQVSAIDNANTNRSAWSAYTEMLVPVTAASMSVPGFQALDVTLALRHDYYSDFGGTTNPKIGIEWSPLGDLRVRATYGTSFKAPSLFDLAGIPVLVPSTVIDRRRNDEITTVSLLAGGSHDLDPEEASTRNVGVEYSWALGARGRLTIGLDKWWIDQTQRIVSPDSQTFVDHEETFSGRVTRAAPTPQDIAAGLPGVITNVDATSINFGRSRLEGEDVRLAYGAKLAHGADLDIRLAATHVDKYVAELAPGATEQRRGVYSTEGYAPEWKASLSTVYSLGGWGATLMARYIGRYWDRSQPMSAYAISATTLFDAQLSYSFGEHEKGALRGVRVALGAENLFDRTPPFFNMPNGYDSLQYDNLGRYLYLQLAKTF